MNTVSMIREKYEGIVKHHLFQPLIRENQLCFQTAVLVGSAAQANHHQPIGAAHGKRSQQ